jgi:3-phosphoshikimate 1-carboxyvinyltransferase
LKVPNPAATNGGRRTSKLKINKVLPDLIEIVPLKDPVRVEITVPGSKSITNRALILAALAEGDVTLTGALWSEDTQIMTEALQKLGFEIRVEQDLDEFCNRTITVKGLGGKIPKAGAGKKPMELFVGNAGTAARFLAAFVCLGEGLYYFSGADRMHDRPQSALFKALRQLGYRIETEYGNDRLPVFIEGVGPWPGAKCKVSIEKSSQFASALLLCAKVGEWTVKVEGENAEESPYVAMTSKMVEVFPHKGGKFQIEPDASSGSYFWAAGWLVRRSDSERARNEALRELGRKLQQGEMLRLKPFPASELTVSRWPDSRLQIDQDFTVFVGESSGAVPAEISRLHDLADSIMTATVIAPFTGHPVKFTDLGRLRVQETERVYALKTELTKCGAKVVEEGDTLTVYPSELHGAEIETYEDHRMAMCFAVLGLKVPGIKIKNPACVKKTFPNFFQKLAAPSPKGLGVTILDAASGRKLAVEELFAD